MNIANIRKPKPVAPSIDDEIDRHERRVSEMDREDREETERLLHLEKTASARPDASHDIAVAEAFLEGGKFDPLRARPLSEISALHAKREVRRRAIKIANDRLNRLREERAAKIWAAHFDEIAEIEKRRVMLAIELQNVNQRRETLRGKIVAAGGAGHLLTDGAELLGLSNVHDEVSWGVERLIADGAATRAEIEKASR